MPTPTIPSFSAARVRSYIFRLPLFTRGVLIVIVACSLLGIQSVWDLRAWGALIPEKTGLTTRTFLSLGFSLGGISSARATGQMTLAARNPASPSVCLLLPLAWDSMLTPGHSVPRQHLPLHPP